MKKISNQVVYFLIVAILFSFVPSTIIEIGNFYYIKLSENSILYIYSVIAQVIAGLLALTLVAIPYLFDQLEKKRIEDETWDTAVHSAKRIVFDNLIIIFILGLLVITCCLLVLSSFNYLSFQDFFITTSTCGFLYFCFYLTYLVIYSFDPQRLAKLNDEYLESFNDSQQTEKNNNEDMNQENHNLNNETKLRESIGNFFIQFSKLEKAILRKFNIKFPTRNTPPLRKAIEDLTNIQEINKPIYYELIPILKFRNSLAHHTDNANLTSEQIDRQAHVIQNILIPALEDYDNENL